MHTKAQSQPQEKITRSTTQYFNTGSVSCVLKINVVLLLIVRCSYIMDVLDSCTECSVILVLRKCQNHDMYCFRVAPLLFKNLCAVINIYSFRSQNLGHIKNQD